MLSSLDALAEKISPGSGKSSPNQQSPQSIETSSVKTHFSQSAHPYQKLDHITNRDK